MAYFRGRQGRLDDPLSAAAAIAAARAAIAEASPFVGKNAVQLHGGMGVHRRADRQPPRQSG
jgi:alkylation response protein AidB-like acyl-CoA dehydrogenase